MREGGRDGGDERKGGKEGGFISVCDGMQILTAGSGGVVTHWGINGEKLTSVPSDVHHIFSLKYNQHSEKNKVRVAHTVEPLKVS